MGRPHSVASTVLFVLFGTAVWFAGWAFRRGSAPRWLSYLAFAVAAATWAFAVLPHTYWLEWVAVFLLLVFVGAVAVAMDKEPARGGTKCDHRPEPLRQRALLVEA